MRFSTLVTVFALMAQVTTAFAQGAPPVAGDGQLIQRRAPSAPPPEQPGPDQGPQGPQQEDDKEAPPLPGEGGQVIQRRGPGGPEAGGYDDGEEGYRNGGQEREIVIENRNFVGGVAGEFYGRGYGGVPVNFESLRCFAAFAGYDPQTRAPMKGIVGEDRYGRNYLLTVPVPIGPEQINVIRAFNGLIQNGVCPGPLMWEPQVVPEWNYNYAHPPTFVPYMGQPRTQPLQPMVNPPNYNYGPRRVYGPRMGYGRPPGPGPYAAPPQFRR